MENLNHFHKLFEYDYWADWGCLSSLDSAGSIPENALKIFGHLIGAQRVWFSRIERESLSAPEVWPSLNLEGCKAAVEELHNRWTTLLDKVSPGQLREDVSYRNSKGVEFKTPLEDVLQHVIMHSAYHRGQVAIGLREAGGKPAVTDYVVYIRQNVLAQ
jgi:uncharacterized damage-inducible protein DinB